MLCSNCSFQFYHLLGYYLCLNTCWKTLEVLKNKEILLFLHDKLLLASILRPLHQVTLKNTQDFIQQIQGKRLQPGDSITSFDVKALFTSVPVQPAIQIVQNRLQQDNTLPQRTAMSIPQIISLLEFCLTQTYFLFQGKYYKQTQGAAMGSPISPLIANIFMEEFEVQALQSSPNPPSMWLRFVDDTFVINRTEHSQQLLQHINNQDQHIQFTVEPTQQGSLPFLDTLVTIQPNNTLSTSVLQKTHTYRPIPPLGQQSPYHSQTQCIQHPSTQGKDSFLHSGFTGPRTPSYQNSSTTVPVSKLGLKPMGTQFQTSQSHFQQQQQQFQQPQQQPRLQQQIQSHHSCPLHTQNSRQIQKDM